MSHYILRRKEMDDVIHAVRIMIRDQTHYEPDKPVVICVFICPMWQNLCDELSLIGVLHSKADHPFVLATLPLVKAQKLFANEPDLGKEMSSLYQSDLPFEEVLALIINGNEHDCMSLEPSTPGIH